MAKLGVGCDETADADLIERSDSSESWMEFLSSIRRRRFSSPSPTAFLSPAFDACAAATHSSSSSGGSIDFDASLLRYTRYGNHIFPSVSSDFRSTSTRRRLRRQLKLRSSSGSLPYESSTGGCSSVSPLSAIDNVVHARSRVHMTPVKVEVGEDLVVMDGVLVSDAGSSNGRGNFKTEFGRAWDENAFCRYSSKCQLGKEELHNVHDVKRKPELSARHFGWSSNHSFPPAIGVTAGGTSKNVVLASSNTLSSTEADYNKLATGCLSTLKSLDPHLILDKSAAVAEETANNVLPHLISNLATTKIDEKQLLKPLSVSRSIEPSFQWPPTKDEDAKITQILYGLNKRPRLPVFTQFCPQHVEEGSSNTQ
ncbi:uncharacterized protein LOC122039900 [Zingiber officinale]|nr:uncharacterized protein LOC122039900 [Zingiber officinale]